MAQCHAGSPSGAHLVARPDRGVFSVIQRKVIRPADFADLGELADRLERFEDRYNATATPFDWRFTTTDLARLLERLDAHQRDDLAGPLAA